MRIVFSNRCFLCTLISDPNLMITGLKRHPPSFFHTNKTGLEKGLLLGLVIPAANISLTVFSTSVFWQCRYRYGCRFGGWLPASSLMAQSCYSRDGNRVGASNKELNSTGNGSNSQLTMSVCPTSSMITEPISSQYPCPPSRMVLSMALRETRSLIKEESPCSLTFLPSNQTSWSSSSS